MVTMFMDGLAIVVGTAFICIELALIVGMTMEFIEDPRINDPDI